MQFRVGKPNDSAGSEGIYLQPNIGWNDYDYVTTFYVYLVRNGSRKRIGEVKIGFAHQAKVDETYKVLEKLLPSVFDSLPDTYFSLGQNPEYYENIREFFSPAEQHQYLRAMKDIAYDERVVPRVYEQRVFIDSLSRFVSESSIKGRFQEIIRKGAKAGDYELTYHHGTQAKLTFSVSSQSKPPSNIHALIGSNGVGKSHILRNIARSIDQSDRVVTSGPGHDVTSADFGLLLYFSLGVFGNPQEVVRFGDDRLTEGRTKKRYIGIYHENGSLKRIDTEMGRDLAEAVSNCLLGSDVKKEKWSRAIEHLVLDFGFGELDVAALKEIEDKAELEACVIAAYAKLSSGHATILFYMTKVVELVEDKTICLFDEPENHLHPPLLARFIRVLSEFLSENNGMAILATHSPVVLQEIPRACVWRIEGDGQFIRPHIETFGESVGEITTDVFDLDLRHSGFYALLKQDAIQIGDYDKVMRHYNDQVGSEGRAVVISNTARAVVKS
ncbi:AAA family ATPase [Pseudomonas xanthosomatis]|uniref:AAA family ATPase n=1 Tax=Pseudomonas xanthosomatis TaxID=2842356 RepID=UPI0035168EEF